MGPAPLIDKTAVMVHILCGRNAMKGGAGAVTYRLLDGKVLDLSAVSEQEAAYVRKAVDAYRTGAGWVAMSHLVESPDNPWLRETHGVITRQVWDTPGFQALRDLEDRAGMRDGSLRTEPGFDPAEDPAADEWISTTVAAKMRGVTLGGLLGAIRRGDVLARPRHDGGTWREVSLRSLLAWQPNATRQAARKRVGAAKKG